MSKVYAVCVLVINPDGKILSVSRKNNSKALGLPGGKIDPGETAKEAAIRELKEETGLDVESIKWVFRATCHGNLVMTYQAETSGDISTSEAGVVQWVSIDDLIKNSPFKYYNKKLFKELDLLKEEV